MAMTVTVTESGFSFSGRSLFSTKEKNTLLKPYGMMLHQYGIVLEILPDGAQAQLFARTNGCARVVHNDYLDCRIAAYKEDKRILSVSEYKSTRLKALKAEKPWLKEVDKFALEAACEHVDAAYKNFFEGRGKFPKYASRRKDNGNRYTTKSMNGNIGLCLSKDGAPCVKLPKAGPVPFILPKRRSIADVLPDGARITKATVSLRNGRWFVSLAIESVIEAVPSLKEVSISDILAGDAGLKEFLIYGGRDWAEHVPNPRWVRLHAKRLRRYQKKMSRRQYDQATHTGSKNWEKARAMVAKEHLKTANQRKDFQHKLSRKIADTCMVFIREDLNIRGMMKNRRLASSIASVGWSSFFEKLEYKLRRRGGLVLKAGRFYASSQTCSACGYKDPSVKDLKVRKWACPHCGASHDRDENAKDNLLEEGIRMLGTLGISVAM